MILPPGGSALLVPVVPEVPSWELLRAWRAVEFEPRRCRTILEETIERDRLDAGLFDLAALDAGGPVLTEAALFPFVERWRLVLRAAGSRLSTSFAAADLPLVAALLRDLVRPGEDAARFRERWADVLGADAVARLSGGAAAVPADAGRWPAVDRPGLYRREHASLLLRSARATVLVDPIGLSSGLMPSLRLLPAEGGTGPLDAVLITHSHGDHWQLPSILRHDPSGQVPVVVPRVPRPSLICPEALDQVLSLAGQRQECREWWSTYGVGDLEVDVLPFYGEQPTRDAPGGDPRVRNWGNCYRVNAPGWSALILVDSGRDPQGDMVDVIERSVRERGPVDVVLSCLREFRAPFMPGLASYWVALPFAQLAELHRAHRAGELPSVTGGTRGAAAACVAARASYYLPYAHGFEGVGAPIAGNPFSGAPEAALLDDLDRDLRAAGASTRIVRWNPGDVACPTDGRLDLLRAPPGHVPC